MNDDWLLIGCPVYQREWILPHWFAAIEQQDFPLEDIGFIFFVAPNDEPTMQCLLDFHADHPEVRCFDIVVDSSNDHLPHIDEGDRKRRTWSQHRYGRMASFRNALLERVVCLNPARYFSLDSDILLEDPTTISQLWELTKVHGAVAPLCFMVPPEIDANGAFPNVMSWAGGKPGGGYRSGYQYGEVFKADVIMAAVMMSKETYTKARYAPHRQGEDLGWALNCARLGIDLWSAANIYAAHVMYKQDLEQYLRVGDPRSSLVKSDPSFVLH